MDFSAGFEFTNTWDSVLFAFVVDNLVVVQFPSKVIQASQGQFISYSYALSLATGRHTFKMQWATPALSGMTASIKSASVPWEQRMLFVRETW